MTYKLSLTYDKIPINTFQKRINDFKDTELNLRKLEKYNCLISVKKSGNFYEYYINSNTHKTQCFH